MPLLCGAWLNYLVKNMANPKLELTWIGKEKRPKLEPRILLEEPDKSYHAQLRRELFARQDSIEAQRNALIDKLEAALQQAVQEQTLFTVAWELK